MNYIIRKLKESEYNLLENFLYEAIFIPNGETPPPKNIIELPELKIYIENFGQLEGDLAIVAEVNNNIVGATWVRIMNDYGHIDDNTPSFAISLYKEYRGLGIGTAMMKEMLLLLSAKGYNRASLSVQKSNYAVKMYQNIGFTIIDENEEEYIMAVNLKKDKKIKRSLVDR
jgi:hypothetical protein